MTTTTTMKTLHTKILYECSLNIEPPRKFVHLRCTNGFRWKLPAEPDRLLPITCASFDALEKIVAHLAAWQKKTLDVEKAQQLQSAINEAQLASAKVSLPIGETKDTLHTSPTPTQCILFPRWIDRDWPIPAYGQTLAESFRALAYLIERGRKTWPKQLPKILDHLNGFWEQLERAERASLASPEGWTVYDNPAFEDSPVRPTTATTKFLKLLDASNAPVPVDELTPSLTLHDPGDAQALDELLSSFLNHHELSGLGGRDHVIVAGTDKRAA